MIQSCFWRLLGFVVFFNGIEIVTCICDIQFNLGSDKLSASNNGSYICGKNVAVQCTFSKDILYHQVELVKYSGSDVTEIVTEPTDYSQPTTTLQATIYSNGLYRCQYYKGPNHNTAQDPKCATNITIYTTGSGDTCHNGTVTPPPSTIGTHFPGLNPLIYTVVSGLLLFILILVSIITCWIRSRKNARMRALLPQESPQDYLDYIQQGQFTPLTSIEFVASLRERPPTYNESQVIQRRMDEESPADDDDTSRVPPPLPPRNPSMRSSPIETESETRSDTPTTPTSTPRPPVQSTTPDTSTTTQPSPATPNLFPNDVSLSNFLLDDLDVMDQLPPPLLITPDPPQEGSGADIITSDSNTVLMGVIPSINNAMV